MNLNGVAKTFYRFLIDKTPYGEYKWKTGSNKASIINHRNNPLPVTGSLSEKILDSLNKNGYFTFNIAELAGGSELFNNIIAEENENLKVNEKRIDEQRNLLENNNGAAFKNFLVDIYPGGGAPSYNLASSRFALHPEIVSAINAYLGLYAKVRYLSFWLNLHNSRQKGTASQLWHRDHEDRHLVKVFLYLNDVDESNGPFSYVPGMHKGKLRKIDPVDTAEIKGATIRANDESMTKVVPQSKWFIGAAPKGTIIIADTKSYHKGGLAKTRDRHLLTAAYFSIDYPEIYLKKGINNIPENLHPAIKFAGTL